MHVLVYIMLVHVFITVHVHWALLYMYNTGTLADCRETLAAKTTETLITKHTLTVELHYKNDVTSRVYDTHPLDTSHLSQSML